jgi:hypothetical protein
MRIAMRRAAEALLILAATAAHAPADAPGETRSASALPLSVDMECPSFGGGLYTCQAYPNGGSGTGYSFTWSSSNGYAWETYDADGSSEADAGARRAGRHGPVPPALFWHPRAWPRAGW